MKNLKYILIFILLLGSVAQAEIIKKRAVVRDQHFHAEIDEVILDDLVGNDSYEGKYFKIVKGKTNEVVRFDDSEDLQLKAATTYYHLTKARNFFVQNLKLEYVKNLPVIVIRLDITNVFNEVGHFANDNLNPQYNNALSVPRGKGYAPAKVESWNEEIWFRPSKEVHIKDLDLNDGMAPTVKGALSEFRNQTHMTNFKDFFVALIGIGLGNLNSQSIIDNMMRFGESSVVLEFLYQTTDIAAEFFSRKIYRLDSALVPEIIYHEFSHVALSESLELSHSTPVNEGMADYFAGKIANSKQLATHINDYNLFSGKKVQKKQLYHLAFERGEYANSDFVFGLLWNLGATVGNDIESNFMYEMSKKLSTNSDIRNDLIKASLDTCNTKCKTPFTDKIKLYQFYNKKGL